MPPKLTSDTGRQEPERMVKEQSLQLLYLSPLPSAFCPLPYTAPSVSTLTVNMEIFTRSWKFSLSRGVCLTVIVCIKPAENIHSWF